MEIPKQETTNIWLMKLENKVTALNIAISEVIDQYPHTTHTLIEIRDEFEQQLKDAQFDHDNFVNKTLS